MSAAELRTRLTLIKEQDYAPPEDTSELTAMMLTCLGHPDGELRDDLIYLTFVYWIDRGAYSAKALKALLATVLGDTHLFLGLGEIESDSVFTRSFSVLLVPPILARHRQDPFLSALELAHLQDRLATYLAQERDLRGFVVGKGWAHAVSHTADALASLAICPELDGKALYALLELVRDTTGTTRTHFSHGEDERLSWAALQALSRNLLDEDALRAWLESFRERVQAVGTYPLPEGYWGFLNLKHFLRALYFAVKRAPELSHQAAILTQVEALLSEFDKL